MPPSNTTKKAIRKKPKSEHESKSNNDANEKKVKKTKGRVKIKMELIGNKLRRQATFSKRKSNLLKKAYELWTLTGSQVLVVVASETSHVYTFATPKLQPIIGGPHGKTLIETCISQPNREAVMPVNPTNDDEDNDGEDEIDEDDNTDDEEATPTP